MSNVQNELSVILSEQMGEDYFACQTIPLHAKTLSAHGFSAISFAGASLYQKASSAHWHGRLVSGLTDVFVATLYVCNSLVATVEAIGTLAYALLVSSADSITGMRVGFLHSHAIKTWSYCVHSVVLLATQVVILYFREFPSHHSSSCLVTHAAQLLSSALVLTLYDEVPSVGGEGFDEREYAALVGAVRTFIECGPLVEFLYALNKDFGEGASEDELKAQFQRQSVIEFFLRFPLHQEVFQDLGITSFRQQAYRMRWRDMAADFVRFSYHPDLYGDSPEVHVVSSSSPKVSEYQKTLEGYIKAAVKKIYHDDTLVAYLSERGSKEEGRSAIESFWPQVYLPLAYYAQLTELEAAEVQCPENFESRRLRNYDGRRNQIITARKLLEALPVNEKPVLVKELLRGRADDSSGSKGVKKLFYSIGELAEALHQGTLMSMPTIESITGYPSGINYFQKAYMEAVGELNS